MSDHVTLLLHELRDDVINSKNDVIAHPLERSEALFFLEAIGLVVDERTAARIVYGLVDGGHDDVEHMYMNIIHHLCTVFFNRYSDKFSR